MDNFHLDLTSLDSKEDFPSNKGNTFRVKLCESLTLSGRWEVVLTSLTLFFRERDAADVLSGLELDIYTNIVGLSIVGASSTNEYWTRTQRLCFMCQLLKIIVFTNR